MYKLLFYIVLVPFSLLPMKVLYLVSDFLCWILKDVLKYRRAIIWNNLHNAFPDKDDKEIHKLVVQFYHHLSDIFIEAFKMLTLSRKGVMKRYRCINPEITNKCYNEGKHVILISGHYNNWEYMVLSLNMQFKHHGIGVGKPLSNKGFGNVLTQFRTRYGTEVIDGGNIKERIETYDKTNQLSLYMMLNDQSPGDPLKCYWTPFLNQDTGVVYGPELYAKRYGYPVFFYGVKKVKRGYYEFEIQPVAMDPKNTKNGEIITKSAKMLEQLILENPANWLWSHKRWKHKRPAKLIHPN